MKLTLYRHIVREHFDNKMRCVLGIILIVTTIVTYIQFSPARELGNSYDELIGSLEGPFTNEKDKKIEFFRSEYQKISEIVYDDLNHMLLEDITDKSSQNDELYQEMLNESNKYLSQKGKYGATIQDDMLMLSKLINQYDVLRAAPSNQKKQAEGYLRNSNRQGAGGNQLYWNLLYEKNNSLEEPDFYDTRPIECFFTSFSTDWIFILFIVFCVSSVFTSDYEKRKYLLLRITNSYGKRLAFYKLLSAFSITMLCVLLSFGANFLILLLHTQNFYVLLEPIQSVSVYASSVNPMSILEFIALMVIEKFVQYACITFVVASISLLCRKITLTIIFAFTILTSSVIIEKFVDTLVDSEHRIVINLFTAITPESYNKMDEYVLWGNRLVPYYGIMFGGMFALVILSLLVIIWNYKKVAQFIYSR